MDCDFSLFITTFYTALKTTDRTPMTKVQKQENQPKKGVQGVVFHRDDGVESCREKFCLWL